MSSKSPTVTGSLVLAQHVPVEQPASTTKSVPTTVVPLDASTIKASTLSLLSIQSSQVLLGLTIGCGVAFLLLLVLIPVAVVVTRRKRSQRKKAMDDNLTKSESVQSENNNSYSGGLNNYSDIKDKEDPTFYHQNINTGFTDYDVVDNLGSTISSLEAMSSELKTSSLPTQPEVEDIYCEIDQMDVAPALPGGHPTMLHSDNCGNLDSTDPYVEIQIEHPPEHGLAHNNSTHNEQELTVHANDQTSIESTPLDSSCLYSVPLKRTSAVSNSQVPGSRESVVNMAQEEDILKQSADLSELYAQPDKLKYPSSPPGEGYTEDTAPPLPPRDDSLMDNED